MLIFYSLFHFISIFFALIYFFLYSPVGKVSCVLVTLRKLFTLLSLIKVVWTSSRSGRSGVIWWSFNCLSGKKTTAIFFLMFFLSLVDFQEVKFLWLIVCSGGITVRTHLFRYFALRFYTVYCYASYFSRLWRSWKPFEIFHGICWTKVK